MDSSPVDLDVEGEPRRSTRASWTLAIGLVLFIALRVGAAYQTAGNWDEFGLLENASKTAESGTLFSSGRPGLAQLLLVPLVAGCRDEMSVLLAARLLWLPIVLALLAGVAAVVWQLQPDARRRPGDALLAVALLACVPEFLEWSLQVRTDQIALAGGVWGTAALLASRRQPALAFVAGVSFAIGFLSSQKLLYVLALAGLLATGQLSVAADWRPARDAARAGLCAAAFALALWAFHASVDGSVTIAEDHPSRTLVSQATLQGGLDAFAFYRKTIGWSQYRRLLGSLGPHLALLLGLTAASVAAVRGRSPRRAALGLAWATLCLGAAVAAFHAAAFFYFWMTLGLFPAVAFALARDSIETLVPRDPRVRTATLGAFWLLLAGPAVVQSFWLLDDTQSVQRESLAFVHHNFAESDAGFQPESALFCRGEGQPIQHYYSWTIYNSFATPGSEHHRAQLIRQFRDEPVLFLVESFRLNQFPVEVRRFWAENYQPYRASVFVAGRRLEGSAGAEDVFELLAPGEYRWLPFTGPQTLSVDGRDLAPGEVMRLEGGEHVARFVEDVPGGILVLAMNDPPDAAPLSFYKGY